MDKAALAQIHRLLDEMKYCIDCIVLFIEDLQLKLKYILFFICPVHRKVVNSKTLPQIGDLLRYGVDNVGHFVAYDELYILR